MVNQDGVSYHCFNCGFKSSWQTGRPLSAKFKKLLKWLSVPDDTISKCAFEALRLKSDAEVTTHSIVPAFTERALPMDSKSLEEWSTWIELQGWEKTDQQLIDVFCYLRNVRGIDPYSYPFYWTSKVGFKNRLIIPFFFDGKIVGYTARAINDVKPKYISEQQPGYVFNLDRQTIDRQFVFVCEGPIDAISIDGVAVMSNEVSKEQRYLIDQLRRQVVVVPDKDKAGKKLIEQALEFGWSVSFPEWDTDIKDINDSIKKHGRLYTLYNIVQHIQNNALKIQLAEKSWYSKELK